MNQAELAVAEGLLARALANLDKLQAFLREAGDETRANLIAEHAGQLREHHEDIRICMRQTLGADGRDAGRRGRRARG